jgi:hypothetical protein
MRETTTMSIPSIRPTQRILSINHSLVCGEPLLLLPACLLVRWRDLSSLPEIGAAYSDKTITVSVDNTENVGRVLLSSDPLARCDASKPLPLHVLSQLYSYSQAKNMRRVAERLCPEVRQYIHAGAPASLRRLFRVAYGESPEEQVRRWNESLGGSTIHHLRAASPRIGPRRDALRETPQVGWGALPGRAGLPAGSARA